MHVVGMEDDDLSLFRLRESDDGQKKQHPREESPVPVIHVDNFCKSTKRQRDMKLKQPLLKPTAAVNPKNNQKTIFRTPACHPLSEDLLLLVEIDQSCDHFDQ
jgi:hypothetical protein